jgi:hypothetical protein
VGIAREIFREASSCLLFPFRLIIALGAYGKRKDKTRFGVNIVIKNLEKW